MGTRLIKPSPETLRQEIETNVMAFNKYLDEAIEHMNWHQLLCNCHPIERSEFAWRLYKGKLINREDTIKYSTKKD